jgi:plasmid stability protein
MADVLIRDVPDAVLAAVDVHAARSGQSRVEYIRRRLASDAATANSAVSPDDLRNLGETFADLVDDKVMGDAWR